MKRPDSIKSTAALLAALLAGCAAGPDYHRPAQPTPERYTTVPLVFEGAASSQHFAEGVAMPEHWWTLFGSAPLNALVEAARRDNPDLQAAAAALRMARENAAAQRGAYLPVASVQLSPSRQKVADPLASPLASNADLYTLHTAQLSIGYVADVFGGLRRQVEGVDAQHDVARFQYQAVRLTLEANLVVAAIAEAALREQVAATREMVVLARSQRDAVHVQRQQGQTNAADVAAQEVALAQVQASLPPLMKQLAQQHDLVAALTGRTPGDDDAPVFAFASLALPAELPVSLPARLIEQRPDVRAAEAQLRVASAQVGVAAAARLPTFALSATLGSTALSMGSLFKSGTGAWSIGADLVQPLFHGGMLQHQQRAAEAGYDQAAAQYRTAVLAGFQGVADSLQAIVSDAQALQACEEAERAARTGVEIATRQWELGAIGHPLVLQATQAQRQATLATIQARAVRYTDTVALFQALGGGWQ
jgi:NodT family efflux transporter outer membrane factor (OMF) lipoprotein